MTKPLPFFNLYRHEFVRLAVAVPELRVGDPAFNAAQTLVLMREADAHKAAAVVFPELGLPAYTCEDLFHQRALREACLEALAGLVDASRALRVLAFVGVPIVVDGVLVNCAVALQRGRILAVIPKTYLPNYREFYERRQFAPGYYTRATTVELCGQSDIPFGPKVLLRARDIPSFVVAVEICEDLWVPLAPSSYAALAGATVLVNLSASNATLGKAEYRRSLASNQSARCLAAYVYSAAGQGESTTDLAWDGHGMIHEDGTLLAETRRYAFAPQLVTADVDLGRLAEDRIRQTTFGQSAARHAADLEGFRTVDFAVDPPADEFLPLARTYERFPFVPSQAANREERCREVYDIQVQALVTRLKAARVERPVIGISGGLDSTQALLVCARATDVLGWPRERILAVTMPGFATSARTLDQAHRLMRSIGCEAMEIDIRPGCLELLKNIDHPYARGEPVHDITFENVQAGERTSVLFRLANHRNGLVVGTSDLSELALGWSTYGVGDHMAHYHVNASVPKTLIQYLIRWVGESGRLGPDIGGVLGDVLATEISPELVPGDGQGPAQRSEDTVGPYELQDFHLYYLLRYGHRPSKVAFLAWSAWHDRAQGHWPGIAEADRHQYAIADIRRWLAVFVRRFFGQSQFKRSAIPNAPKVGSGGSLSPRGDWRAPSDGSAAVWLADVETIPERDPAA